MLPCSDAGESTFHLSTLCAPLSLHQPDDAQMAVCLLPRSGGYLLEAVQPRPRRRATVAGRRLLGIGSEDDEITDVLPRLTARMVRCPRVHCRRIDNVQLTAVEVLFRLGKQQVCLVPTLGLVLVGILTPFGPYRVHTTLVPSEGSRAAP